jgi:choloylglycine hydrolase
MPMRARGRFPSGVRLGFKPGAPVQKLTVENGEVFAGRVADQFEEAELLKFL